MIKPKIVFIIAILALFIAISAYSLAETGVTGTFTLNGSNFTFNFTKINISQINSLETWNATYYNGSNAEGTLINTSMRNGASDWTTFFFSPGAYEGNFRLGSTNKSLILDPDQDPVTGQYGYIVDPTSNYATIETKGRSKDAAIISRVQQNGSQTSLTQYGIAMDFIFNGSNYIQQGCGTDGIVGYRCGFDLGHNNIYNSPDISNIWSSGVISGGNLSHSGQNVNITGGIVILRSTPDSSGFLFPMPFSGKNFTFAVGDVKYIYANYTSGAVELLTTTNFLDINGQTSVELYQVFQENTTSSLYIDARSQNVGIALKETRRLYNMERFRHGTGAIIGAPSALNLSVSSGGFYYGMNLIESPAFNTATGSSIEYYYRDGVGGYNSDRQFQINNTYWDDGTGMPIIMNNNKYKVEFVFIELSSNGYDDLAIVMGQTQHNTIASAEAEVVPSNLPTSIVQMGVLIGRIIIQYNTPAPYSISSAFTQQFTTGISQISESQVINLTSDLNKKVNKTDDTMSGNLTTNGIYVISGAANAVNYMFNTNAPFPVAMRENSFGSLSFITNWNTSSNTRYSAENPVWIFRMVAKNSPDANSDSFEVVKSDDGVTFVSFMKINYLGNVIFGNASIAITKAGKGFEMKSPNGNSWCTTVSNTGALTTTSGVCP